MLDDFSMGLDPGYRRLFVEYLRDYAQSEEKTVFLTSHIIQDMEKLVDDCIIMDYGSILVQMPVGELLGTFRRYTFTPGADVTIPAGDGLYHPSVVNGAPNSIRSTPLRRYRACWSARALSAATCAAKR